MRPDMSLDALLSLPSGKWSDVMEKKIWLDDMRPAPDGWVHVQRPEEAIAALFKGGVTHFHLDHDLDDNEYGTGYDVLLWIEQATMQSHFTPPLITVHSANESTRQKMEALITKIGGIMSARTCYLLDEVV